MRLTQRIIRFAFTYYILAPGRLIWPNYAVTVSLPRQHGVSAT